MTFADMKALVSYNVDDLNFGYFTEIQVETFLNNGLKEAQKRLIQAGENFYLKKVCTPVLANQSSYILPLDFMATRRVEIYQGTTATDEQSYTMAPVTLMEIQNMQTTPGDPSCYYLTKDRLVFDRPYTTNNVKRLRLHYDYFVGNMTTPQSTPDLPERYHEYPCVLATLDCIYKDGRNPEPFLDKKNYYEMLMKQDAEDRTRDEPRMIRATQQDSYWAY